MGRGFLMSLIRYATRIHFAVRVLEDALAEELRAHAIRAPLIVVDKDGAPCLSLVLDSLPVRLSPQVLHLENTPSPQEATQALRAALDPDARQPCDAIIGLGGKGALDLVRCPNIQKVKGGGTGSAKRPTFVIPTLPGSVGLSSVVLSSHAPGVLNGQQNVPDVVFCDPSLLQMASPRRLAMAGMDAMVHCLEALLSDAWNPPADGMAFDGLRRAGLWLERMVADPQDSEAGREVLAAALNGELASQKGAGALHALAHAFEGATKKVPEHGLLHGALIAAVLKFNAPAVPEQMSRAADALRLPDSDSLVAHFADFGARLGLPRDLRKLGLTPQDIATVAERAARESANRDNPRLATSADYASMIESAI